MLRLFSTLLNELNAGRGAVLCSILASSGSTPRGAGAKMLVLEDGSTLGTVGGGAVELHATSSANRRSWSARAPCRASSCARTTWPTSA